MLTPLPPCAPSSAPSSEWPRSAETPPEPPRTGTRPEDTPRPPEGSATPQEPPQGRAWPSLAPTGVPAATPPGEGTPGGGGKAPPERPPEIGEPRWEGDGPLKQPPRAGALLGGLRGSKIGNTGVGGPPKHGGHPVTPPVSPRLRPPALGGVGVLQPLLRGGGRSAAPEGDPARGGLRPLPKYRQPSLLPASLPRYPQNGDPGGDPQSLGTPQRVGPPSPGPGGSSGGLGVWGGGLGAHSRFQGGGLWVRGCRGWAWAGWGC